MDLVESFMREAKWYYSGYKPSMEEYMKNACISIAILSHAFFRLTNSYSTLLQILFHSQRL